MEEDGGTDGGWVNRRNGGDGWRCGLGMAVEGLPVVERVGGWGVECGARDEGDNGVAEKPGGVGREFLFERVEDDLLVTLLAKNAVEYSENLGATA